MPHFRWSDAELSHFLLRSNAADKFIVPRMIKWAGHVARMGNRMNTYRGLVGKPEGKNPL